MNKTVTKNINNSESASVTFELDWDRICNCIGHEMWPKLASSIRAIVNEAKNEIKSKDFSEEKNVEKIIDILKNKRNLVIEERTYLKQLIKRAKQWKDARMNAVTDQCLVFVSFCEYFISYMLLT